MGIPPHLVQLLRALSLQSEALKMFVKEPLFGRENPEAPKPRALFWLWNPKKAPWDACTVHVLSKDVLFTPPKLMCKRAELVKSTTYSTMDIVYFVGKLVLILT